MKITLSGRYNETQDHATTAIGLVPIAKMSPQLKRWCIWHNARPDRITLVPSNEDRLVTYGGDALLLAEYTEAVTYQKKYPDSDTSVEMAVVFASQLEDMVADLVNSGITLAVIPADDEPLPIHE